MQVCDNVGDHLIGNVYARYEWETEAQQAVDNLNERWYAGTHFIFLFHPRPLMLLFQVALFMRSFLPSQTSVKPVVAKTRTANVTAGGSAISCICDLPQKNSYLH